MKQKTKFILIIVLTAVLCSAFIYCCIFFVNTQNRFNKFLVEINNSTRSSTKISAVSAEYEGESYGLSNDNAQKLYSWIIVYGPGREKLRFPSEYDKYISIKYADGAILEIAEFKDELYLKYLSDNYRHTIKIDLSFDYLYTQVLSKDIQN